MSDTGTRFEDFIAELRAEAEAEGPDAVAEFEALDACFAIACQTHSRELLVETGDCLAGIIAKRIAAGDGD
jgi:hypothetical protein